MQRNSCQPCVLLQRHTGLRVMSLHLILFRNCLNCYKIEPVMTQDSLLIDAHNPLLPYKSPADGVRGETLSGQVYQDAYCRLLLVTNPQHQLFVPIIQWID